MAIRIKASKAVTAFLKRWFEGLEVVEAEKELRIQPNAEDVKTAIRGDPRNCVFSRACQRMWGSRLVAFFGTVAYVDLLDGAGKRRVERFMISANGSKELRAWDEGKRFTPKGFLLLPPPPSNTLAGKAKHREALLKGESTGHKGSTASRPVRPISLLRLTAFRNGVGMVHFSKSKAATK